MSLVPPEKFTIMPGLPSKVVAMNSRVSAMSGLAPGKLISTTLG